MLIHGTELTPAQRALVLRAFVHRWTHENAQQTYGGKCPGCEQSTRGGYIVTGPADAPKAWTRAEWHAYHAPLTSDAEWLSRYAFHFTKDGSRLKAPRYAEPARLPR
jgi:hypothetical protein